jgi:hypothetical protein
MLKQKALWRQNKIHEKLKVLDIKIVIENNNTQRGF